MIEDTIISHLVHDEEYSRKVLSFLDSSYFQDKTRKTVFETINSYVEKYNSKPSFEALKIDLSALPNLNESSYLEAMEYLSDLQYDSSTDKDWLVDQTEKFCKDKALYNAIMDAVLSYDGRNDLDRGAIPKKLQDALSVSFNKSIGHNYFEDASDRYDFYHKKEDKIDFDIELLNYITKGGISRKTLTIIMAGTGVGKSLAMCHFAASNLMKGKNVLYLTLEMARERISERIDFNLMNVTAEDIMIMSKSSYLKKIKDLREKTLGQLVVEEYPPAAASTNDFRHLLDELRLKKNFVPDVIYVDYLNLAASARIKMGSNVNSYGYIKAIAEELRGLAVEYEVPVVSATQVNREGMKSSDFDLTNTSESIGLPYTADLMFALISDEELEELNQIVVKQLKNRYSSVTSPKRFVIGIDRKYMRFYNVDSSAQKNLLDGPEDIETTFDKTSFGMRDEGGVPWDDIS